MFVVGDLDIYGVLSSVLVSCGNFCHFAVVAECRIAQASKWSIYKSFLKLEL
jgi:hypothetical protein